jgi:hypothetical protein
MAPSLSRLRVAVLPPLVSPPLLQIGTAPRDQYTKSYISKEMVQLNLNTTTAHAEFLAAECVHSCVSVCGCDVDAVVPVRAWLCVCVWLWLCMQLCLCVRGCVSVCGCGCAYSCACACVTVCLCVAVDGCACSCACACVAMCLCVAVDVCACSCACACVAVCLCVAVDVCACSCACACVAVCRQGVACGSQVWLMWPWWYLLLIAPG